MSPNRYLPDRSILGSMLEAAGVSRRESPSQFSTEDPSSTKATLFSPPARKEAQLQPTQALSTPVAEAEVVPPPQPKPPPPEAEKELKQPVSQQNKTTGGMDDTVASTKPVNSENISFRFNPKMPMEQNLRSFLMWLINKIEAEGGFITDSQGLALVACNISMDYIESTGALSQGLTQMSAFGPSTDIGSCLITLEAKKHLLITWAETGEGRLFFGLVTKKILNSKRVRFIRMALKKIVG